jgi:hypothetical protein
MSDALEVLQAYREQSDPRMQQEAQRFRALSACDQRELLFWMAMSNGAMINQLTIAALAASNPGTQQ